MGLLLVLISNESNRGPILPISEILELLYAKSHFFSTPLPYSAQIFGVFPM